MVGEMVRRALSSDEEQSEEETYIALKPGGNRWPQPKKIVVRHSAWEADRLRACNEVLGGVLQPEVDMMEEMVRLAISSEEEQSEEEACTALKPGGSRLPAARDKRGRGSKMGAGVRSKRVKQGGAGRWRRSDAVGKWHMEGFREDPESDILVQGDYAVGTVRVQEQEEGLPAEEGWLGVRLKKEGVDVLGWMQAGELREKVAGRERWVRRLRGKGDEGWDTAGCRWASKSGSLQADREVGKDRGSGKVGGVVGWYLPVQVMEEKFSKAGVRVCMQMRRVAFGKEVVSSLARKAPSFKCTM